MKLLTDKQKIICKKDGKFVVQACPGSGKTFTVAAKMARLLRDWKFKFQGIGVISFTNVAANEIERVLSETFSINTPIEHPHFIGTIDSFINQYIFFPYGHLILKCRNRPSLVGKPAYPWNKSKEKIYKKKYISQFFDRVSHGIDDQILQISNLQSLSGGIEENREDLEEMKNWFHRHRGYVNQSDVNYFSLRLLEKYPQIARKIILRFPYLIVDEAQDTSKIQMRIFDLILDQGLKDFVLVGDPDQAIFEFTSASPEFFRQKADLWGKISLNESWRSSQKICNFTYRLTNLKTPTSSINKDVEDFTNDPTKNIWGYDSHNNLKELINQFLDLCKSKKIPLNSGNIAILTRNNSLIHSIRSIMENISSNSSKWTNYENWKDDSFLEAFAKSKYLYDHGEFQKSFLLIGKTYFNLSKGKMCSENQLNDYIKEKGFFSFKEELYSLIKLMPSTNISIGEWKDQFEQNLRLNHGKFEIDLDNIDLSLPKKSRDSSFRDVFNYLNEPDNDNNKVEYLLSNIHKVKGQTFEAVLLIVQEKSNGPTYKKLLKSNSKTDDHEELRNIYVGVTRPRKVLSLAVPSHDKRHWDYYFSPNRPKITQTTQINLESFNEIKN